MALPKDWKIQVEKKLYKQVWCSGFCKSFQSAWKFNKHKNSPTGLGQTCRYCCKINYRLNRDKRLQQKREYWIKNKERLVPLKKLNYQKHRTWIIAQKSEYGRQRRKNDPLYEFSQKIRGLIGISLRNQYTKKATRTENILGCSFEILQKHFESLFYEGMSWNNKGILWEIDHSIPVSAGRNKQEVLLLNHHKNLRPLLVLENRQKSDKFPKLSICKQILRQINWNYKK
jgi:TPP-dependent indolepyruvate ferredoxin oxidoreductase alpha subunit